MAAREPKGNGCRWRCPTMNRRRETTAFNRYHHPIPNITTTLERRKAKTVFSPCYDGISGISSFFCPLSRVSHGNVLPFKILSIRRYQSEWLPARYDDGYLPKKIGYKWAKNRRSRDGAFPKNMSPPSFLCNLIVPSHFFPPLCPEHILILWCKYKTSFSLASYFFQRSRKVSQDQWPESTNFARKKERDLQKKNNENRLPKGPLGA